MDLKRGDLLLLPEGAQLANVSVETFRYWVKTGRLPSVKPGRRRMVLRSDVVAFVMRTHSPRAATRNENGFEVATSKPGISAQPHPRAEDHEERTPSAEPAPQENRR